MKRIRGISEGGEEDKIKEWRATREREKETEEGERGEGSGRWGFGVFTLSFPVSSSKYLSNSIIS